eukprot:g5221.t1
MRDSRASGYGGNGVTLSMVAVLSTERDIVMLGGNALGAGGEKGRDKPGGGDVKLEIKGARAPCSPSNLCRRFRDAAANAARGWEHPKPSRVIRLRLTVPRDTFAESRGGACSCTPDVAQVRTLPDEIGPWVAKKERRRMHLLRRHSNATHLAAEKVIDGRSSLGRQPNRVRRRVSQWHRWRQTRRRLRGARGCPHAFAKATRLGFSRMKPGHNKKRADELSDTTATLSLAGDILSVSHESRPDITNTIAKALALCRVLEDDEPGHPLKEKRRDALTALQEESSDANLLNVRAVVSVIVKGSDEATLRMKPLSYERARERCQSTSAGRP